VGFGDAFEVERGSEGSHRSVGTAVVHDDHFVSGVVEAREPLHGFDDAFLGVLDGQQDRQPLARARSVSGVRARAPGSAHGA